MYGNFFSVPEILRNAVHEGGRLRDKPGMSLFFCRLSENGAVRGCRFSVIPEPILLCSWFQKTTKECVVGWGGGLGYRGWVRGDTHLSA